MPVSWGDVVTLAVTLPGVEESTSHGTPALKVAGTLMGRLRSDGPFALKCSSVDKEFLVNGPDPAFFTTSHYDGYNYVLIDLDRVDPAELAELVEDAWHIAAPARLKATHTP